MLKRDEILRILDQAHRIDPGCELFGASRHRYQLNPPANLSFVRRVEERYNFSLPEDYFYFITEIGDGGAGPDYGIYPFSHFMDRGESPGVDKFREALRCSLAKPFTPWQMQADQVEEYAIVTREYYEKNPEKYFIYEKSDENALCDKDGFLKLGTHGCQWDFGIITSGEWRGQVFDTDNEGAYGLVANSFEEFYQNWLKRMSDTERLRAELAEWRNIFRRNNGR